MIRIPSAARLSVWLILAGFTLGFAQAFVNATPSLSKAGKLVIASGAVSTSSQEVWDVLLAGRLQGRPIGIVSTASAVPAKTGIPFAAKINQERGAGSALFIPLGRDNSPTTPEAMRQGGTRIERGRACFEQAAALAGERGWPFGWTIVEAEGIGHSSAKMFAHPRAREAIFGRQ